MTVFNDSGAVEKRVAAIDVAFDYDYIWHPYSSMKTPGPMFPVASAEGAVLTLADGRQLIDGMASWWAAIHGYNVPELNEALQQQLPKMAHVMFGGLTHAPAIELAKKLIELTAPTLQKVFFADSGSVAVEVALKMALQYWQGQGEPKRQKFLTVKSGYHGDTFATMAFADPDTGMHSRFGGLLAEHLFAPAPPLADSTWDPVAMEPISQLLADNHQQLAGVILEPIVQGAGGMRIYAAEYLTALRELCDRYDLLLILDEIATGFGRTGTLFAYEQAGVVPDILCLGKALTGGYMTLAATLTTDRVANGIAADGDGTLMHGPTFMANPLACAVANASIDLLLTSPWQSRVQVIEKQLQQQLEPCCQLELVADVRVKGAIGVIELTKAVDMAWVQPRLVELGVWIRPFGKLLYVMPPYIINSDQLAQLTTAMRQVVSEMAERLGKKSNKKAK
ncbi:MAG: adenosylmethionine--8-amino-7-oxononanoate transaminase [Gammaproteobacteria bacterium]|nr:MAG: adenosylmethionine--8-amino-7-oxononanoate transaminase [Gammaproteobacteria bacterium]